MVSGSILQSTFHSTISKEIIITAEIVADPELYKDKLVISQKGQDSILNQVQDKTRGSRLDIKKPNRTARTEDVREIVTVTQDDETFMMHRDIRANKNEGLGVFSGEITDVEVILTVAHDKMAGASIASTNSEIDPLKIIRDSIERAKVYPPLARKKGIEGKVILRFRVSNNGEIDEVRVVKGSGFEILDRMSIETIKRSAPLPYVSGWIEIPLIFRLE